MKPSDIMIWDVLFPLWQHPDRNELKSRVQTHKKLAESLPCWLPPEDYLVALHGRLPDEA